MKHIVIFILALALLPLLFKLLVKSRLIVPLLYAALASTVFVEWTEANQTLSMVILCALLGLVAISWLWPLLRRWRESRMLDRQLRQQIRSARAKGAETVSLDIYDGVPIARSN